MAHFILRYRGSVRVQADAAERIRSVPNTAILDSSDRMMLVDGPEDDLRAALNDLPGWSLINEQTVPLLDPRKRVLRAAGDTDEKENA